MRGLKGKVAVIAGAATGIGKATAIRLSEEGVSLVLGDINVAGVNATAELVNKTGGKAIAVAFDISDDESVKALVDHAMETYGGLDFMHANAADLSLCAIDTHAIDVPLDLFDRTIAVNLRGHLLCTPPRHSSVSKTRRRRNRIHLLRSGLRRRAGARFLCGIQIRHPCPDATRRVPLGQRGHSVECGCSRFCVD